MRVPYTAWEKVRVSGLWRRKRMSRAMAALRKNGRPLSVSCIRRLQK